MDFLPIKINGKRVYAGFWKRFFASCIDFLIIMSLFILYMRLDMNGFRKTLALVIVIPPSILFSIYNVYFNARFGGTPGKLAVGIRITKPNGSCIGWREALKRSAVGITFVSILLIFRIRMFLIDDEHLTSFIEYISEWKKSVLLLYQAWIWSEVIVLFKYDRKRAIHDFIAGTVVINKKFAVKKDEHQSSENDLSEDLLLEPLSE
jgi:uncharacterized RDD family membrane protein YckC